MLLDKAAMLLADPRADLPYGLQTASQLQKQLLRDWWPVLGQGAWIGRAEAGEHCPRTNRFAAQFTSP